MEWEYRARRVSDYRLSLIGDRRIGLAERGKVLDNKGMIPPRANCRTRSRSGPLRGVPLFRVAVGIRCAVQVRNRHCRLGWAASIHGAVTQVAVAVAVLLAGLVPGCLSSTPELRSYSVRPVLDGTPIDVLDRAESVLRGFGLTIGRRDGLRRVLVTNPFDVQTRLAEGARPGPPETYARRRRVVRVWVERGSGEKEVRVFCRVEVQERTTQALRMLSLDQRSSDVPDRTAIEREAATTVEQNTVWQTTRRDHAAERAILEAIIDKTNGF